MNDWINIGKVTSSKNDFLESESSQWRLKNMWHISVSANINVTLFRFRNNLMVNVNIKTRRRGYSSIKGNNFSTHTQNSRIIEQKLAKFPHSPIHHYASIYGALLFSVSPVRCTCIIKYGAVRKFFPKILPSSIHVDENLK